jgi:hypothetical protein
VILLHEITLEYCFHVVVILYRSRNAVGTDPSLPDTFEQTVGALQTQTASFHALNTPQTHNTTTFTRQQRDNNSSNITTTTTKDDNKRQQQQQ